MAGRAETFAGMLDPDEHPLRAAPTTSVAASVVRRSGLTTTSRADVRFGHTKAERGIRDNARTCVSKYRDRRQSPELRHLGTAGRGGPHSNGGIGPPCRGHGGVDRPLGQSSFGWYVMIVLFSTATGTMGLHAWFSDTIRRPTGVARPFCPGRAVLAKRNALKTAGQGLLHPLGIERMFPSMDRPSELESMRRSIAMLKPRASALDREEAMALLAELQEVERRLKRLRDGLRSLLHDESP